MSDTAGVPIYKTQSLESSTYGGPFIAHKYRPLDTSTQNSTAAIAREGQDVINISCYSKWHNVNVRNAPYRFRSSNVCYVFSQKPPEYHGDYSDIDVKDWGIPLAEDDDVFLLDDLREFESTDFRAVLLARVETAESETRYSPPDEPEGPPNRRRIDPGSLHNVIPHPHMHPSLTVSTPDLSFMPPYTRKPPIPISSHNATPPLPFSRNAWIVPVRGTLPWADATSAIILDPLDTPKLASPPDVLTGGPIVWTHPALNSFWLFLLHLREEERLGSLGVSFHAVKTSFKRANKSPKIVDDRRMSDAPSSKDSLLQQSNSTARTTSLSQVDYIKVYHDAQASMNLRNALDVWAYLSPDIETNVSGPEASKKHKIRILKGARLALLDQRSNGILLS